MSKDIRVGDNVSVIINAKVSGIGNNGNIILKDNDSPHTTYYPNNVFHGHIDGTAHETKPVRTKIMYLNTWFMPSGNTLTNIWDNKDEALSAVKECKNNTYIQIAVPVEVDENDC